MTFAMSGHLDGESTTQSRNGTVQDASLLHLEDQHIVFVLVIQVKMQLKDAAQHRMEEGIMVCAKQRPLLKTPNMVHGIEKLRQVTHSIMFEPDVCHMDGPN
ncbi:hypothetical protein BC941DRAFT_472282 [Chlamydoabsidia padenii]|nr:hypothetical protein BC941DRAFT_472282 [Chlamydoabsidia padenii]